MYKVHLWLNGKHFVDFLLAIIELFSLALTAAALLSVMMDTSPMAHFAYYRHFAYYLDSSPTHCSSFYEQDYQNKIKSDM